METHRNDIRALTGLRGLAALWVVMFHVLSEDRFHWPFEWLVRHGYMAVDIFFVLSGFVMSMSYTRLFDGGITRQKYLIFMIRRFARVYPLYFVMTAVVVALNILSISRSWTFNIPELIANLTLTQAWGFGRTIDGPAWSVSTELAAYILFPFLTLLPFARRSFCLGLSLLCFLVVAYLYIVHFDVPGTSGPLDVYTLYSPLPLMRCLAEFTIGMCMFGLSARPGARALFARRLPCWSMAALFLVLCSLAKSDLALFATVPFLIMILAVSPRFALSRFLAWRPIFFLGEVSYAVYLLHFEFERIRRTGMPFLMKHGMPALAADIVCTVILYTSLIGASYAAFRLIEVPARRAIRRLEDAVTRQAAARVAESEAAGRAEIAAKPSGQ